MLIEILNHIWVFILAIINALLTTIGIVFFVCAFIGINRVKKCVLVDFDSLVDIEPIKQREKIWYDNHPEDRSDCLKYMVAHISEQTVIANQILKCRLWQGMGYKLIYVSGRHERLRMQTAKILNEWELKGELYCSGTNYYKECDMKELTKKHKVIGVITTPDEDGRKFAEVMLGSKRL